MHVINMANTKVRLARGPLNSSL